MGPVLRYVQYMGPSLNNVLVKYVQEHSGDICPIYEQYLWLIYEPYFVHGPSNILTILKFLRGTVAVISLGHKNGNRCRLYISER